IYNKIIIARCYYLFLGYVIAYNQMYIDLVFLFSSISTPKPNALV
ncbi:hypothetical protein CSC83_10350, partial [Staphylococcus aureus]